MGHHRSETSDEASILFLQITELVFFPFLFFVFLNCVEPWSPLGHFARPSEKGSCFEQGLGCGEALVFEISI